MNLIVGKSVENRSTFGKIIENTTVTILHTVVGSAALTFLRHHVEYNILIARLTGKRKVAIFDDS